MGDNFEIIIDGKRTKTHALKEDNLHFKFETKTGGEGEVRAYIIEKENQITCRSHFELTYRDDVTHVNHREGVILCTDIVGGGGETRFVYYLASGLVVGVSCEPGGKEVAIIIGKEL